MSYKFTARRFLFVPLDLPPVVIPAKAGTQEAVETKRFFSVKDELSHKGLKWATFLRNVLFVLGSCFRRNDDGGVKNKRTKECRVVRVINPGPSHENCEKIRLCYLPQGER